MRNLFKKPVFEADTGLKSMRIPWRGLLLAVTAMFVLGGCYGGSGTNLAMAPPAEPVVERPAAPEAESERTGSEETPPQYPASAEPQAPTPPEQQPVQPVEQQPTEPQAPSVPQQQQAEYAFEFDYRDFLISPVIAMETSGGGRVVALSGASDGSAPFRSDVTTRHSSGNYTPSGSDDFAFRTLEDGADYIAFGYWLRTDWTINSNPLTEEYRGRCTGGECRAIFVVIPSDYFIAAGGTRHATDIAGVAGTATYRGSSSGFVSLWEDGEIGTNGKVFHTTFADRPSSLTADFDRRVIRGRVDIGATRLLDPWKGRDSNPNWSWDGITVVHLAPRPLTGPIPTDREDPDFSAPNIQDNGTFSGDAYWQANTLNGQTRAELGGTWRGRFYSPRDSGAPGLVAGMFSATRRGEHELVEATVQGVFGGKKTE